MTRHLLLPLIMFLLSTLLVSVPHNRPQCHPIHHHEEIGLRTTNCSRFMLLEFLRTTILLIVGETTTDGTGIPNLLHGIVMAFIPVAADGQQIHIAQRIKGTPGITG
eukprot:TRINITY_DN20975_c0_g1_i1.p2 TRINITY_DN20975_c0_g1~~TRINITY_DN20975_c0_g1_i1.p2  ORF type:complete len:107 (-),score=4.70 TRINITY_DN20975_c0_g1_i1:43-363(-)